MDLIIWLGAHALTNVFPGSVDLIPVWQAKENQRQWIVEENSLKISTIAPGVLESYSKKQLINGLIYHLKAKFSICLS